MYKALLSIILFSCLQVSGNSTYSKADTSLVIELTQACFDLVYNKTQEAKTIGFRALKIAKAIPFPSGEAQAYSRLGIVYDVEGKFDSALYFYQMSLKIYKQIGNKKGEGAALCNMGLLHLNRNNYTEALINLHAAIQPLEIVSAHQYLGNCYNNIGLLYHELDNYEKAAYNYRKAIDNYDKVNNVYQKANALGNLANLYSDQDKYETAVVLEQQAIDIYLLKEDHYNLGKSYNNIAECLRALGNIGQCEEAYLMSIQHAEMAGNKIGLAATLVNLGLFYYKQKNEKRGIEYIRKSYEMCQNIESPKLRAEVYNRYAKILMSEGKYKLASELMQQSFILKDSIFKYETAEKIAIQEARFGIERKENENNQLKQTNKIQELELQNQKEKNKYRQLTIYGIVLFTMFFISSLIIYFKRRQKLQQLKDENRHQIEQNKQRLNISHELHDNVGAQLSYIVSNLSLVSDDNNDFRRIQSISEMSKQAIITLRETVWALNKESIELTAFSDKFKQYISKILEYNPNIVYSYHENIQMDEVLEPMQALNLFRICQEAFSNAVHHASASEIHVYFSFDTNRNLFISIEDNGIGFDETQAVKTGHFGLHSMKTRAEELGAKLVILSQNREGSRIQIKLHVN